MDTTKEINNNAGLTNKVKLDATFWGMTSTLFIFWLIFSESLHYQEIILGLACSFAVALFNNDLFLRWEERPAINKANVVFFIRYCFQLIGAIFLANLQVAAIVLNPRMPISPGMVRFKVDVEKNLSRVVLGNSITLTPGTLTVHMEDDIYLVHALTEKNAESVINWDLAEKLGKVERK